VRASRKSASNKKFSRNEKFFENRRLEPPKIPYCETYSIVFSQCVINGAGRRIFAKSLLIDFQKACDLLYKLPANLSAVALAKVEARAPAHGGVNSGEGEAYQNKINSLWWYLLNDARTFFEENS